MLPNPKREIIKQQNENKRKVIDNILYEKDHDPRLSNWPSGHPGAKAAARPFPAWKNSGNNAPLASSGKYQTATKSCQL